MMTKSEKKEQQLNKTNTKLSLEQLNSMSHKLLAHGAMVDLLCTVPACLVSTQEGRVLRLCQTNRTFRFRVRAGQRMNTSGRDGGCVCVGGGEYVILYTKSYIIIIITIVH